MTRAYGWLVVGASFAAALVGCNDHDRNGSTPTPATTDFETYVQSLAQDNTCESNLPAETNGIIFSYAADEDSAAPRDTAGVNTGCKS